MAWLLGYNVNGRFQPLPEMLETFGDCLDVIRVQPLNIEAAYMFGTSRADHPLRHFKFIRETNDLQPLPLHEAGRFFC